VPARPRAAPVPRHHPAPDAPRGGASPWSPRCGRYTGSAGTHSPGRQAGPARAGRPWQAGGQAPAPDQPMAAGASPPGQLRGGDGLPRLGGSHGRCGGG
jgi:hypothetical protein